MEGGEAHRVLGAGNRSFCTYHFLWSTLYMPVLSCLSVRGLCLSCRHMTWKILLVKLISGFVQICRESYGVTEQKNLVEDGDKILVQKDNRQVGHLWGWTRACAEVMCHRNSG